MSLNAVLGKALDGIVAADPALSAFGKLKGSGADLLRYLRESAQRKSICTFHRPQAAARSLQPNLTRRPWSTR